MASRFVEPCGCASCGDVRYPCDDHKTKSDVQRFDQSQAVYFRDEAGRLRDLIAAIVMRHPDGLFVPDTAVEAKRGRDVAFLRHPMRAGYIVTLKPEVQ